MVKRLFDVLEAYMIQQIPLAHEMFKILEPRLSNQKISIQLKMDIRYTGKHILTNRDKKIKSMIRYSLYYLSTKRSRSQFRK